MGWNDVLTLLTAIGGAVYMTFQITWTIFKEIHNNKKCPPQSPNPERSFLLTSQRELTIADSTFSMYSIACFPRIVKED